MKTMKLTTVAGGILLLGIAGYIAYLYPVPMNLPLEMKYFPAAYAAPSNAPVTPSTVKGSETLFDLTHETVGAEPVRFTPIVGSWLIGVAEDGRKVLVVDGRKWSSGQTSASLADKARALYGERYAEFLDNVKAYAYFPFAVATGIDDFRGGEIRLRFEGIEGRIDQAAGIVFNLKPNGDYLILRANCLEDNLVLFKYEHGKRSSVKWIRNTPTPSRQWHDLKLQVQGANVKGYLDGKLYLEHTLPAPVSGKVGVWSKADSVVYFDQYRVTKAG
jgi:hypothetical protein